MTQVTVAPHALDTYVRAERNAADAVGVHARRQHGEVGALTTTFGVIGAEFLAATAYVLDHRARNLEVVAARHAAQSEHTRSAAAGYGTSDTGAGATIARAVSGDQELRL